MSADAQARLFYGISLGEEGQDVFPWDGDGDYESMEPEDWLADGGDEGLKIVQDGYAKGCGYFIAIGASIILASDGTARVVERTVLGVRANWGERLTAAAKRAGRETESSEWWLAPYYG